MCKLNSLLAEEHAYWSQRAKISWLKDGDRNTKFFHCKASNHHAKNRLVGLFDDVGIWQSTDKGLEDVVFSYFWNMFTATDLNINHMLLVVELIQPKVSDDMNRGLCA